MISEEETEMAIEERHYDPPLERNVFVRDGETDAPFTSPPNVSTIPSFTLPPATITPGTLIPTIMNGTLVPSGPGTLFPPTANFTISPSTLLPSVPNITTFPTNGTLAPTLGGIEAFLEATVSPGGELRIPGTPQNDALNSVLINFGQLDPAIPADALVLSNAYGLNTLYFALSGTLWMMQTNWNSAVPPCDPLNPWFGIACDAAGSVSNITLSGADAVGSIPSEIRAFPSLSKYCLSLPCVPFVDIEYNDAHRINNSFNAAINRVVTTEREFFVRQHTNEYRRIIIAGVTQSRYKLSDRNTPTAVGFTSVYARAYSLQQCVFRSIACRDWKFDQPRSADS